MVIIETPIFTKQLLATLSEEEYRLFQAVLLDRPDSGKLFQVVVACASCDGELKDVASAVA